MQTIVETPEYCRRAERLLAAAEREAVIDYLAAFPKAGVILRGTGGIRKLRWARPGAGKRGGVRVIYYFHNERMPLYLLTLFGKGEQANLTPSERNELAKLVQLLLQTASVNHE